MNARVLIGISALIVAIGIYWQATSHKTSPSFADFTHRDTKYYASLAEACNMLLLATRSNQVREIRGDEELLPCILHNLNSQKIEISKQVVIQNSTDRNSSVQIFIGHGRLLYCIGWTATENNSIWVLEARKENEHRILFSTEKSVDSNMSLPRLKRALTPHVLLQSKCPFSRVRTMKVSLL